MSSRYDGPVIDCSVAHHWGADGDLIQYMSEDWIEYVGRPATRPGPGSRPIQLVFPYPRPGAAQERVPTPPELIAEVFGDERVTHALLTHGPGMFTPAGVNPRLAHEISRAVNDWTTRAWLDRDQRLLGTVLVPNQVPELAAEEIRRAGAHPQMAGILMAANGLSKPFGHPSYLPVYEAAVELGMPVILHAGGDAIPDSLTQVTGGGPPSTYGEYAALSWQSVATHVVSMIGQGLFERLPALRVLVTGAGLSWVLSFIWRCDTTFKGLRREVPWVKRLPSEYFVEHFRVVAQPLDQPPKAAMLTRMLGLVDRLDEVCCYGSGSPGPGATTVDDLAAVLPRGWSPGVFAANAASCLRLPRAAAA